ncbi:MAG: hypothetical protein A2527_02010 [Candidatus Lambdaproteobacteria bacterium RIFOXYD2_FULL_50_16]|uniref:Organic solvent tolerance-like N-terminal domain-containing protein n=1 Tax=Candidatus Lambdaproteobacteria bacterium RIFOXYD2_FULL_50_16 TaxID=1817772 RepID=A0A1F6G6Y7_9PROT|nr:MAG: hypothetical protein A2527_02010 [Candidatus Lambdaproteobacteria bacterium RIFOXYD2_FULL_50_16]
MKAIWGILLLLLPGALVAADHMEVRGQRMYVDKNKGSLVIEEKVEAQHKAKGIKLWAELLEILRDTTSDEVVYARAYGKVKVTRNQEYAFFEEGIFEKHLDLATLTGHLIIGDQEVRIEGHEARYDLRTNIGKVTPLPGERVAFSMVHSNPEHPEERHLVTGTAGEVLVYEKLNKMVLQGGVVAHDSYDDSNFKAERIVAFLDAKRELEEMTAVGSFEMTQPGRWSIADRAVLEYGPQIVTLLSHARVRQTEEGEVTGDRIEMHMDASKGFLKGKRQTPLRLEIPVK